MSAHPATREADCFLPRGGTWRSQHIFLALFLSLLYTPTSAVGFDGGIAGEASSAWSLRLFQLDIKPRGGKSKAAKGGWKQRRLEMQQSADRLQVSKKLRRCGSLFERCWNSESGHWRKASMRNCAGARAECERTLCGSWLEANCIRGEGLCSNVSHMCRDAVGPGPTSALLQTETSSSRVNVSTAEVAEEEDQELVFLHIPKTAGTAIENAALENNMRWGRHRMYYFGMMPMPDNTFWCAAHHVPPKILPPVMADIYREGEVFCVARNPYERIVSEYKYLLSVPWGITKPGVLDHEPCTPEGINSFLNVSLSFLEDQKTFVNDCHMVPQTEFIFDGDKKWCDNVLRFEDMPQAFNELMEKKNSPVRIRHSDNGSKETCPGLSANALSDEVLTLINKLYDDDFKRLGYAKRLPSSSPAVDAS